jgi:hypothetical protein
MSVESLLSVSRQTTRGAKRPGSIPGRAEFFPNPQRPDRFWSPSYGAKHSPVASAFSAWVHIPARDQEEKNGGDTEG